MNLGEGEDEATEPQAPAKAPTNDGGIAILKSYISNMPCQNVPVGSQPLPHRQLHAEGADHSSQEEQDTHLKHNRFRSGCT